MKFILMTNNLLTIICCSTWLFHRSDVGIGNGGGALIGHAFTL
jgi:hypothetical protein